MTTAIGVAMFPTDRTLGPDRFARAAEDRGFDSVWFPEHTHIPVAEPAFPDGRPVPEMYRRCLDPFAAIAAAAAVTERVLLGTGICLVIERDPIITAKEVATVDLLSGGRFLFGVGAGWNRTEMANHGTDPRTRFSLLAERLEAMKAIWASEEASYHGTYVDFGPIWQWPKPVQRPHPPIVVGGVGPGVLQRVVDHGDAWLPNAGGPDRLAPRIAELQERAAAAGRGPIPVTVFGCRPEAEAVGRYAAAGAHRVVFWVQPEEPDAVLRQLDALSEVAADAAD